MPPTPLKEVVLPFRIFTSDFIVITRRHIPVRREQEK
jgi:hypothetical protein